MPVEAFVLLDGTAIDTFLVVDIPTDALYIVEQVTTRTGLHVGIVEGITLAVINLQIFRVTHPLAAVLAYPLRWHVQRDDHANVMKSDPSTASLDGAKPQSTPRTKLDQFESLLYVKFFERQPDLLTPIN